MMRRAEFIAFLVAAMVAGGLLGVLLSALSGTNAGRSEADRLTQPVYRSDVEPMITTPPDTAPEVEVLAGTLGTWDDRTRGLEASLRLHLWLALRDVHPTGPTLQWSPATRASSHDASVEALCLPDTLDIGRRLGRNDPPLLTSALRKRARIRVFLAVSSEVGLTRVEAHVCTPGSRGSSQVFVTDAGREGPTLRETMAWLTGVLGSPEVEPWFSTWSRPFAPDVAALRTYGDALAESMQADGPLPLSLLEAAALLPEASWLAGELSTDPLYRRRLFQRAAALRPGFTAALEDLAWEWSAAARPDLAMLSLSRLRAPERTRPSELLLAARLLEAERPADASLVLDELAAPWTRTTAARRLEAKARLGSGNIDGALAAASAWAEADPSATEAWLLLGDAEQAQGNDRAAEAAYRQALSRPSRLRSEALTRWAVLQLSLARPRAVEDLLGAKEEEALVSRTASLLALRAWARWQLGDAARAASDTALLAELEPEQVEHRRNLCVLGLSAGTTEASPEECGETVFADLFGTLMEAVWLSRRPFRSPEQGGLLDRRVTDAAARAPLAPAAAGAALRVLGPRATKEELAELQMRWQLARGTEPLGI